MLEIRNVTKIYHTKAGADVTALNNVSVSFEETGLVFLLGKSGSGKSTLLNLAGGLDEPTSGEIVVMGKSSKDFSGSDFDSYRNTYIGFVFQEYNVLNEFNVEDNVSLALELQGKTHEKQKVMDILREVELDGYAKRRPNTLSGGQKQRIAIARALVKDPQIIMADEPTGALDSATGKQVFETLKALSKSRLVIVVSHDREFAEIYGDRIIELKDGEIISDVTKFRQEASTIDENVTKIGEHTLSIKSGAELSEKNFRQIQEFVKSSGGNVIISKGENEVKSFKKANRIDESNSQEGFKNTETDKIKKDEGDHATFIKSRLPARKAIKIGASSLKLKPIRLVFTVLLSLVAFVMFGLFSTLMLYDGNEVLSQSFAQSGYSYLSLQKYYYRTFETTYTYDGESNTYSYYQTTSTFFTPEEVTQIGGDDAVGAYQTYSVAPTNISLSDDAEYSENYYYLYFTKAACAPEGNSLRNLSYGTYPKAANEIAVSSYFAECALNCDWYEVEDDGTTARSATKLGSESELIGKNILLSGNVLKITGIFESDPITGYDSMKTDDYSYYTYYLYRSYLEEGLHTCLLVSDSFAESYSSLISTATLLSKDYFDWTEATYYYFSFVGMDENNELSSYSETDAFAYYHDDEPHHEVTFFKDSTKSTLSGNEIAVPIEYFLNSDWFNLVIAADIEDETKFQDAYEEYYEFYSAVNMLYIGGVYEENENGIYELREATDEELAAATKIVNAYLNKQNPVMKVYYVDYSQGFGINGSMDYNYSGEYTIVGYYLESDYGIYVSDSVYESLDISSHSVETTTYVQADDAVYAEILVPYDGTETGFNSLYSKLYQTDNNVYYALNSTLESSVTTVNSTIEMLSTVFLVIGIVLAVFASLLLFNFISMSITNKKRDIGILRAVGARGTDVFKIFFSESGIIVGICVVLALIGTAIVTAILNNVLRSELSFMVQLFVFGPLPALIMIAIAAVVALISTFLPVYFSARKKPVESIRAL